VGRDQDGRKLPHLGRAAHLQGPAVDAGAQHAEARGVVVADDARRKDAPVSGNDQDGARLEYQVADRDDEPLLAEHHPRALALGPQVLGRARIRHRLDGELHDAFERHVVRAQLGHGEMGSAPGGEGRGEEGDGHGRSAR
jgi:hypothetical protein